MYLQMVRPKGLTGPTCMVSHPNEYMHVLIPWMPVGLVMQGLVDVGRMGCSSLAAPSADIHQSKESICFSENKTNCNVVPYVGRGPERVKHAYHWQRHISLHSLSAFILLFFISTWCFTNSFKIYQTWQVLVTKI
jgi:hypothetical protein